MTEETTIVLVHGACADASGFGGVIRELQAAGHTVTALPNPLRGISSDAGSIATRVRAIGGPVVLVGHSYAGAPMGQAAAELSNVTALVFLAAVGLDVGESVAEVQQPFPPPLVVSTSYLTDYDAPGAAGGPELYIQSDRFQETVCADAPSDVAEVMAVTQRRSPVPRGKNKPPLRAGKRFHRRTSSPNRTTRYLRSVRGSWPRG
jgi:pimeloyl-ACP methyl ester carboxylesterase